jgi:T5SS/PEP-CTERM-associated repeat protein/autotransporter-associated beta strand protein
MEADHDSASVGMRDGSTHPLDTMNRHARRAGTTSKAQNPRNRTAATPDFRLRPTIVGLALMATVTGASPAAGVTASAVKVRSDTYVGFYGKGQAIVSDGGALTTGSLSVGTYSYFDNATNKTVSGDGSVTVDGAGSKLSVSGQLTVGELGVGTLSVSNGAKADAQSTSIGQGTGSTGTVKVAGAGSQLTLDDLTVADAGTGTVEVAGGGALNVKSTAVSTVIGAQTGAQGSVRVTGAGSTLGVASAVTVGESGVGTLSVADGARGTIGGNPTLGTNAKGDGTVKVTGALSNLAVAGTTSVGQAGLGVALVDQGGQLGSAALQIGSAAAGLGYVGVDGAGSTLAVSQALDVGTSGRGVLSVSNGAQATSATTTLGSNAGSVGVVVLAGAGSALTTGDVFLGRNDQSDPASTTGGLSSFTVTDAATLHAGTVSVATSTGSAALLNIGAGASSAAATPGTIDAKNIVFGQGDGVLVLNHTAQDYTFAPTIEGTGRVLALSGTTTLASGNTYTGGTSITGTTTLKGSATSFGSGAIQNNGALVLDQPADAAFANVMAGTGSLTKTGSGLLNVTGDSSGFTGTTTVAAGRLAVNGSLSGSAVTVQSGATLSGAGTVGSVRAQSGATVAPGNSPGTLSVAGDYHQAAGATYAAELVPGSTVSDRIAVSGVTTLDSGAILNVSKYGTGSYRSGARYTVLTSLGGVKGTYTLTGDTAASAFFSLGATYDANHVYLDYTQSHTFADFAKTPNETAAASGLQKLADSDALRTKVLALRTGAEAQRAYDQLSGELHASTRTVLLQDSRFMRDATTRQVYASGNGNGASTGTGTGVDSRKDSGESVWAHAYGASGRYDGDGNAAGLQRDIGGLFAGTDAAVSADIAPTKVYDGRADAGTVVYSTPVDPSHLFGTPTLAGVGRNVGTYTATPTGVWSDQQGYLITFVGATTTVTPATLVVTAAGGIQVYDGTRNAVVTLSSNAIAGDQLTLGQGSALMADKNVGTGKAVTVSGISLSGADAGNYVLAGTSANTTTTVTPATLNVSASAASQHLTNGRNVEVALGGDSIGGDVVAVGRREATVADGSPGPGRTVTVTGLALSGLDAGNYVLASDTVTTTVDILPPSPTVVVEPPPSAVAPVPGTFPATIVAGPVPDDGAIARAVQVPQALRAEGIAMLRIASIPSASGAGEAAGPGSQAVFVYATPTGSVDRSIDLDEVRSIAQVPSETPLTVPVADARFVSILDGGVRLPKGVAQRFFASATSTR